MNVFVFEVEGISKFFFGVKVFDNVLLCVCLGMVYVLMGENGVGKFMLMKCLIGIYCFDKGLICVKGELVEFIDIMDVLCLGILMIYQEFNLVLYMMVVENIWLGCELMKYGFVDYGQLICQIQVLLDKFNICLIVDWLVGDLSIVVQQMVEIVKVVLWNVDIVIMDEFILVLIEGEVVYLFIIICDLCVQGKVIIYISYKMDEIFVIIDEISVFCDGIWVGSKNIIEFIWQLLIIQMVGCELIQLFLKFNNIIGEEVLMVCNLMCQGVFYDVSFSVCCGEILGVVGLVGVGCSEVMESLFGMECFDSGEVLIDGVLVIIDFFFVVIEKGMVLLIEDWKKLGLFLVLLVLENMSIVKMLEYIGKSGFVQYVKMVEDCME